MSLQFESTVLPLFPSSQQLINIPFLLTWPQRSIYLLTGTACTASQGQDHIETVPTSLYHILTLGVYQQAQQEVCPSTQCLYPD